ncbi:hypothetical protein BGX26_012098 [Mortierella sp. AD094]|nr:hypothetical protein BGX26_012098 [Mortierella sp. AD094]
MTAQVVATLCLESTGQTLELRQDATLLIGRGTFTGVTSTHIIKIFSVSNEVRAVRLGSNRSQWNGKTLPKDAPVLLRTGGVLTLLETDFPVVIKILQQELGTTSAVDNKSDKLDNVVLDKKQDKSNSKEPRISPSNVTPPPSVLRSPPPAKSPALVDKESLGISDQPMIEVSDMKSGGSESDVPSDSDAEMREDRSRIENSDVSVESSIICQDLSELDNSVEEIHIDN